MFETNRGLIANIAKPYIRTSPDVVAVLRTKTYNEKLEAMDISLEYLVVEAKTVHEKAEVSALGMQAILLQEAS